MKKIYLLFAAIFIGIAAYSQCSVSITNAQPTSCFGVCDGSASATPVGVPGYTYLWMPGGQTIQNPSDLCAGTHTVTMTDAASCQATATVTITQPADIVTVGAITNTSCNGACDGNIVVTVNGGTPGYTYSWAPGGQTTSSLTGQCAGSYTLTVTDQNGCMEIDTFTVTEPALLTATVSHTDASCNGVCDGTATAMPSGGTAPYSFSWMPGGQSTGLCAGTYTVTITDANGCTVVDSAVIAEPALLVATVSSTNASCNGGCDGSASVTVSGGTAPYTYLWMPSGGTQPVEQGLCAGTYTCTVTDANGCTTVVTVSITEPSAVQAIATATNVSCFGVCDGTGVATASGGVGPYSYTWTPGNLAGSTVTGLCAGSYSVSVVDANGCLATTTVMVTQPPALVVTTTSVDATSPGATDGSATASASGGTGPYTYLWTPGNVTTPAITGLGAGSYVVCVTDANNCTTCDTVIITDGTGIIDIADMYGITIYPNPASTTINVGNKSAAEMRVTLHDLSGKVILAESYTSSGNGVKSFNITEQPAGIYFLEIEIDGLRITRKVIKY